MATVIESKEDFPFVMWRKNGLYPNRSADQRRRAERKAHETVREFFVSRGFDCVGGSSYSRGLVEVSFCYEERCNYVYRRVSVWVDGKKSNLRGLLKVFKSEGW